MGLEEAIKHCEEKSCANDECSKEHKQLAEWLKELKTLKSISNGVILDGKVYEAIITEGCSGCIFNKDDQCTCPCGTGLCWAFDYMKTEDFKYEDIGDFSSYAFKKVNYGKD